MKLGNIKLNEKGYRQIFNLAPSQYFKSEVDYIKHWSIGFKRIFAFRTFIGIAIPYGNSNFIPFTRSYYAGGSNDNRAWQAYKLGPGQVVNLMSSMKQTLKLPLTLNTDIQFLGG